MARRRFLGPLLFIGICIFGWLLVFDAVAWLLVAHGLKPEMTFYLLAFAAAVLAGLELVSMRVGAAIATSASKAAMSATCRRCKSSGSSMWAAVTTQSSSLT